MNSIEGPSRLYPLAEPEWMLAGRQGLLHALSLAQGFYYMLTGLWPLVSIRTFQAVTGPKIDRWLVKTVGVLVTVIGGALAVAGLRRRTTPEIVLLAAGSAAGLAGIDTLYVARRRISPVYLFDALVELALMGTWLLGWARHGNSNPQR